MDSKNNKSKSKKSGTTSAVGIGILGLIIGVGVGIMAAFKGEKQSEVAKDTDDHQGPVKEHESNYTCPLTNESFKQPVMIKQCGHNFEKSALSEFIKINKKCPTCHIPVNTDDDFVPNYSFQNVLEFQKNE